MKIFKKNLLLLIFILCFFSFSTIALAKENEEVPVSEEENIKPFESLEGIIQDYRNSGVEMVNIREKPTTSSKVLATLPVGEHLTVVDQTGKWLEIKYNDISGFILWKYVGFIEPEITEDSDLIGNSIIHYTSSENRDINMSIACNTINGITLDVNEEFRWSKIIGQTTSKKGYLSAPVIINKKTVPGLGGGVCQVSTTIYNALLDTSITPTEHHKHSIGSAYAEKDATVAHGYKDFVFKNTYDFPISVETYSYKSIVFVNIYKAK